MQNLEKPFVSVEPESKAEKETGEFGFEVHKKIIEALRSEKTVSLLKKISAGLLLSSGATISAMKFFSWLYNTPELNALGPETYFTGPLMSYAGMKFFTRLEQLEKMHKATNAKKQNAQEP